MGGGCSGGWLVGGGAGDWGMVVLGDGGWCCWCDIFLPANRYPPHNCREVIGKRILGTPKQNGWVNPRHTVVEYSVEDAPGIPICWRDKMATEKICSA